MVNFAIRECIPAMQGIADENPNAQVLVRAICFSDNARWHVSQPTDIQDFKWSDLGADGVTDMGHALAEVAKALETKTCQSEDSPRYSL